MDKVRLQQEVTGLATQWKLLVKSSARTLDLPLESKWLKPSVPNLKPRNKTRTKSKKAGGVNVAKEVKTGKAGRAAVKAAGAKAREVVADGTATNRSTSAGSSLVLKVSLRVDQTKLSSFRLSSRTIPKTNGKKVPTSAVCSQTKRRRTQQHISSKKSRCQWIRFNQ